MTRKRIRMAAIIGLVGLPTFIGFAGPDATDGRWDRVSRDGARLVRNLFSMRSAHAADDHPLTAYQEAMAVLKQNYYGRDISKPKENRELTEAAIRGMLYSLNDPFTSFLDKEEWDQMQQTTRGDFEGIGAVLEPFGQDVRVVRPIPESPAFKAGIKAKDVILSVDEFSGDKKVRNKPTLGMHINDVVKLIKGPKGTKVGITVMRKGSPQPISFVITRAHIEPPTVQFWMEDDKNKIGRILLNEFNEKSDAQFGRALEILQKQGMKALVFDLRYNPGGLLNVAVDIGSRFVEKAPVVVIQEKNGYKQPIPARGRRTLKGMPIAVLINENSASASEIVAGAIQDYSAGTLIGEHTFGKGLVQTLFPLDDGSALRLTTAKYFTPKLNDINNKFDEDHRPIFGTGGIKPDIAIKNAEEFVDQDWTDDNKKFDLQLKKALEVLRTKLASVPSSASR